MTEKKIYYHVGLGKAASTYLQKSVFPNLRNIHYIHRNRYRRHHRIVPGLTADRILLSRENSQRLSTETAKLAAYYPQAVPIIVLRRHDGWIASQYRRYVKNGGTETFTGFIDLDQDRGIWKQHELIFQDKLRALEENFGCTPFVVFYEQLRDEPYATIDALAALLGATYDRAAIALNPRHRSYSDKQLQVLRRYRPAFFEAPPTQSKAGAYGYLRFRLRLLGTYGIMAMARFVSDNGFAGEPLISNQDLRRIREAYRDDWQACIDYADANNARHLTSSHTS